VRRGGRGVALRGRGGTIWVVGQRKSVFVADGSCVENYGGPGTWQREGEWLYFLGLKGR